MKNVHIADGWKEQRLCARSLEGSGTERPSFRTIITQTRDSLSRLRTRIMGNGYLRRPEAAPRAAARVDGIRRETRGLVQTLLEGTVDLSVRGARAVSRSPLVRNTVAPLLAANDARMKTAADDIRGRRNLPPEELARYHAGLLHTPGQPELPNQMFEYFPGTAPGPRKLVVLVMGNRQRFGMQDTGMRELQRRFAAAGDTDVLLFTSGTAGRDVRGATSANADVSDTTEVTMANIENILHARASRTGMFAGQPQVDRISMAGFSFGGGVIERLSQGWQSLGIAAPVRSVALVDPIRHGAQHLGAPVTDRPAFAGRVFQAYQTSSFSSSRSNGRRVPSVHGAPLRDARPGDVVRNFQAAGHRELQMPSLHGPDVLEPAYTFMADSLR